MRWGTGCLHRTSTSSVMHYLYAPEGRKVLRNLYASRNIIVITTRRDGAMMRTFPQSPLDLACGNITLKANSRSISKPETCGNVNKQVVCLTLLPNTYHACSYQNVMFSEKYPNFQNTSLLGFKFDSHCLILSFASKVSKFWKYLSLWIQIQQWPFYPISFASKVKKFSKYLSPEI